MEAFYYKTKHPKKVKKQVQLMVILEKTADVAFQ